MLEVAGEETSNWLYFQPHRTTAPSSQIPHLRTRPFLCLPLPLALIRCLTMCCCCLSCAVADPSAWDLLSRSVLRWKRMTLPARGLWISILDSALSYTVDFSRAGMLRLPSSLPPWTQCGSDPWQLTVASALPGEAAPSLERGGPREAKAVSGTAGR